MKGVYFMEKLENNTMYEISAVSELNKVPGFNPLNFVKNTKDGPKLDLSYKKLWFRLKRPEGRIKLIALRITEQVALIEAQVYFDKNNEPITTFTAQRNANESNRYIEEAQRAAIDEALTDAGFGIQFIAQSNSKHELSDRVANDIKAEKSESINEKVVNVQNKAKKENTEEKIINMPKAENFEEINESNTNSQELQGSQSEDNDKLPLYTSDMSVEEICSLMTLDEAKNIIVPEGTCRGWTLSQVADRRPASLKWYISGYTGDNNILRAGAKIMLQTL